MSLDLTVVTSAPDAQKTKAQLDSVAKAAVGVAASNEKLVKAQTIANNITKQGYNQYEALLIAYTKVVGGSRELTKSVQSLINQQKIQKQSTESVIQSLNKELDSLKKKASVQSSVSTSTDKVTKALENESLVLSEVSSLMAQGATRTEALKAAKGRLAGVNEAVIQTYLKEASATRAYQAEVKNQDATLKQLIKSEQQHSRSLQEQFQWVQRVEAAGQKRRQTIIGEISDLQNHIRATLGGASALRQYHAAQLMANGATKQEALQLLTLRENLKTAQAAMDRTSSSAKNLSNTTSVNTLNTKNLSKETDFLTKAYQRLGNVITGVVKFAAGLFIFNQIQSAVRSFVDDAQKLDAIKNSLQTVEGSAAAANVRFERLRDTAKELALSSLDLAKGFANFKLSGDAAGLSASQIDTAFNQINVAAAGANVSVEDFQGVMRAFQQIMSKGNVQAEELRGQLGDRLPGAFVIAARSMGVTTKELDKMLKAGQVVSKDFVIPFAAELEKVFGPAASRRPDTLTGSIVALKESLVSLNIELKEELGSSLPGAIDSVTRSIESLSGQLKTIIAVFKVLLSPAALAGATALFLTLRLNTIAAAQGMGIFSASAVVATGALSRLLFMMQTISRNPIGIALTVIATAATALAVKFELAKNQVKDFTEELKAADDSINVAANTMADLQSKFPDFTKLDPALAQSYFDQIATGASEAEFKIVTLEDELTALQKKVAESTRIRAGRRGSLVDSDDVKRIAELKKQLEEARDEVERMNPVLDELTKILVKGVAPGATEANKELDGLTKQYQELLLEVKALSGGLDITEEKFIAEAKAAGASTTFIQNYIKALREKSNLEKEDAERKDALKALIKGEEDLAKAVDESTKAQRVYQDVTSGATLEQAKFNAEVDKLEKIIANSGLPEYERNIAKATLSTLKADKATSDYISTQEELKKKAEEAAEEMKKVYERAAERIEGIFTNLFRSALDGFDSFKEALKNSFKDLLVELALQATKNSILIPIVQMGGNALGLGGNTIGGITQALGGESGIFSLSNFSNLGSAFFDKAILPLADVIGNAGFEGLAAGITNLGAAITTSLAPVLGAVAGGLALFSAGRALTTEGSRFSADGQGLAAVFAGAQTLLLSGLDKITGGGLFGTKFKTIAQTLTVQIGDGILDATIESIQKAKKSLFRGSKWRKITDEASVLDEVLNNTFEQLISGIRSSQGLFGEVLTPESFTVSEDFKDKSEEQVQAILEDIIGRAVASATVPTALSRAGIGFDTTGTQTQLYAQASALMAAQIASQAKEEDFRSQSTASSRRSTKEYFNNLVREQENIQAELSTQIQDLYRQAAEASVLATDALVEAFGSLDNFFAAVGFFRNNFIDEATRFEQDTQSIAVALSNITGTLFSADNLPDRDAFAALVQSINAATEPEKLRAILDLAPALDAVIQRFEKLTEDAFNFDVAIGTASGLEPLLDALGNVGLNLTELQGFAEGGAQGLETVISILDGLSDEAKQELLPFIEQLKDQIPGLGDVVEEAAEQVKDFTDLFNDINDQISLLTSADPDVERLNQRFRDLRAQAVGADQGLFDAIDALENLERSALDAERAAAALEKLNNSLSNLANVSTSIQRAQVSLSGGSVAAFDISDVLNSINNAQTADDLLGFLPALQNALQSLYQESVDDLRRLADDQINAEQDRLDAALVSINAFYDAQEDAVRSSVAAQTDAILAGIEIQKDAALRSLEEQQRLEQRAFDRQQQLEREAFDASFQAIVNGINSQRDAALRSLEVQQRAQQRAFDRQQELEQQAFDSSRQALVDNVNAQLEAELEALGLQQEAIDDLIRSAEQLQDIARGFRTFVDELNRSDFGQGDAVARSGVALEQFRSLSALAAGGDVDAASNIQSVAQDLLSLGREAFASGGGFQAIFGEVTSTLLGLADILDVASPEQQQIEALEDQAQALRDSAEAQIQAINEQTEELALQFRYAQEDAAIAFREALQADVDSINASFDSLIAAEQAINDELALQFRYAQEDASFAFSRDLSDVRDALSETFEEQAKFARDQADDNLNSLLQFLEADRQNAISNELANSQFIVDGIESAFDSSVQSLQDNLNGSFNGLLDVVNQLRQAVVSGQGDNVEVLNQIKAGIDFVGGSSALANSLLTQAGIDLITVAGNTAQTATNVEDNTTRSVNSIVSQNSLINSIAFKQLNELLESNDLQDSILNLSDIQKERLEEILGQNFTISDNTLETANNVITSSSEQLQQLTGLTQQLVALNQAQFDQGRSPATWLNFIASLLNNGDGVVGGYIVDMGNNLHRLINEATTTTLGRNLNNSYMNSRSIVFALNSGFFDAGNPGYTYTPQTVFAKGGVFTNSVVNGPTPFNMGLMGEAGPEAIMPLSRGADGSLGVQVTESVIDFSPVIMRLDESNKHQAAQVAVLQEGFKQTIRKLSEVEDRLDGIEQQERLKSAA